MNGPLFSQYLGYLKHFNFCQVVNTCMDGTSKKERKKESYKQYRLSFRFSKLLIHYFGGLGVFAVVTSIFSPSPITGVLLPSKRMASLAMRFKLLRSAFPPIILTRSNLVSRESALQLDYYSRR